MASLPPTVHQILGKEASEEFVRWLDQRIEERAVPRDEYREVLSRLDLVEHDLEEVKSQLRSLNERLDRMSAQFDDRLDRMGIQFDDRLDRMSIQFDDRFDRLGAEFNRRMDAMAEQMAATTRWTVGTIALFGTIITILLAISQFAP